MAQPDFTLYPTFANATDSGTMSYYYRDGRVYINNSEHKDSLKRIVTDGTDLRWRATRIKERGQAGFTYTTSLGNTITGIATEDELWVNHNYTGNVNWQNRGSAGVRNSWWYDVDQHREYKVYLVLTYTTSQVIAGNTYADWRVKNAIIEYNDAHYDNTAGTFKFTSVPDNPVTVRGRVHFNSSNVTWPTMSAKLYKGTDSNPDDTVLATQTIMRSSAVDESVSVEMDLDPAVISVNDIVSLAAEVDGTSGQINAIAAPLTVQDYSLEIVGGMGDYIPGGPVMFGGLGQSMDVSDDCNPLLNNVGNYRGNRLVQIIEYSDTDIGSGSLSPSNLEEIRSSSAQLSSVPESYYSSEAINRNRYKGSKNTRDLINSRYTPLLGHLEGLGLNSDNISTTTEIGHTDNGDPIVELKDTFIGYFNQIIDPYPVLNNKTAYFVKYLINENSEVQDPSLSELGNLNFINTFKTRDINSQPAEYLPSIPNDSNNEELLELRETSSLFRVGSYPHPVLWSQTSATTYTQNLPLTGSQDFYSSTEVEIDTYVNLAFRGTGRVTPAFPTTSAKNAPVLSIPNRNLKPSTITYLGENNQEIYQGSSFNIPSGMLTDTYNTRVSFEFYSTSIPNVFYDGTSVGGDDNYHYNFFSATFSIKRGSTNIRPTNPRVSVYHETATVGSETTSVGYSSENNTLPIRSRRTNNIGGIVSINTSNEILFNFHSDINDELLRVPQATYDPERGYRIRWVLTFDIPASQLQPSSNYSFEFNLPQYQNYRRNDHGRWGGSSGRDDKRVEGAGWSRSISPTIHGSELDQPKLTVTMLGSNTAETETINQVSAPYWSQTGVASNQIKLISEHLNTRYAANFFQGTLPYTPTTNPIFPASQEPSFTSFPGATDQFEVLIGDEIRFENNENESYIVRDVILGEQLILTLDRDVTSTLDLDFFLIRRYKRSENIVILNQLKPYSFPPSASSSPGILLPEYITERLETNPDAVITNLIERNLI